MKKIKLFGLVCLSFCLLMSLFINLSTVNAYNDKRLNNKYYSSSYMYLKPEIEQIDENTYIFRDYHHKWNFKTQEKSFIAGAITIGKAILSVLGGVYTACSTYNYVSGHDVCGEVGNMVKTYPKPNGKFVYELTGRYIQGRIPGCEPMHSLACNGYWEYTVKYVGEE